MPIATGLILALIVGLVGGDALGLFQAAAHDGVKHDEATPPPSSSTDLKAQEYFTDLPVIAHDGRELRFYSDVLKNRVVLVSLFYTNCLDACPLVMAKMARLQDELDEELGRLIHFVSLSVDPQTDTLSVVKEYAANFEPRDGWLFLTGDPADLNTIAGRLGQPDGNPGAHPPFLLVGDTRRGYWRKFMPTVSDEDLAAFLLDLSSRS